MISRWAIKRVKDIISGLDQNTDILKFDFEHQEAYSLMQKACGNSNQPNSKAGRIVNAKHAKETATRIQKKYANMSIREKQYDED